MKRRLAALAVLALPMLGGCRWIAVGDSITWGAEATLHQTFGDNGHVDGVPCRDLTESNCVPNSKNLYQVVSELAPLVEHQGTLVIQDEGGGQTYESFAQFVQWVNATVRPDVCIIWVEPFTAMNRDRDAQVTAAIRDNAPNHRHSIVEWGSTAETNPEALVPDGLHPGDYGNAVLVAGMADAETRCA